MAEVDTVSDRIGLAKTELDATTAAVGLGLGAALGFSLLFLQDPVAHDAMHNFRHAAGITCH